MKAAEYKAERELRGTQTEVAEKLGTTQVTLARRENGGPISKEVELALLSLPKKRKKTTKRPGQECLSRPQQK